MRDAMETAVEARKPAAEQLSLLDAALQAERRGDYAVGVQFAEREVEAAAAAGEAPRQAFALRLLANLRVRIGATEAAARACERACALFEAVADDAELCETLNDLTLIYVLLGLHDEALEAVGKALDIARRLGDARLLYWAYNRSGVVRNSQGDPAEAETYMRSALEIAGRLGPAERYCILNNLADNAHALVRRRREAGDPQAEASLAEGLHWGGEALALAAASGTHPYQEALVLGNLGYLNALGGAFTDALAALKHSREIAAAHGYDNLVLIAEHFTAQTQLMQGKSEAGIRLLEQVLEGARQNGEKPMAARVHHQLSDAYAEAGDPAQALRHFKHFHALEKEFNSNVAQTRARMLGNIIELETSRMEAERSRLEAALFRAQSAALEAEKRALQIKADELGRYANQDALTGLWNRRYVDTRLGPLFERVMAEDRGICIALCDIDFFKSINDEYGHSVGDAVLVRIAQLLLGGARQSDIVARIGGEEFLIAFLDSDLAAAQRACDRLRLAIAQYDWAELRPGLAVTLSIGLTCGSRAGDAEDAMAQADALLYRAKQSGRNQVQFSPLDAVV
ncbi:MAG: hypothetical protein B7Z80_06860 [Rhodospirillales bacterium 20-64-7]|nr:MAG: hypothetical protein B7Z80_06860 [Rhodospirillales bacterium 20-64-7]